jgi:hypothetical protein
MAAGQICQKCSLHSAITATVKGKFALTVMVEQCTSVVLRTTTTAEEVLLRVLGCCCVSIKGSCNEQSDFAGGAARGDS